MGMVLRFPQERRRAMAAEADAGRTGEIVILPVIRIERHGETQAPTATPPRPDRGGVGRKGRRKSA